MQVSHDERNLESPGMARIAAFMRRQQEKWQEREAQLDIETFEQGLNEHLMALGRELMTEELSRYDVDAKEIEVGGMRYGRGQRSTMTYQSAVGPVVVERYLYSAVESESKGVCPMELRCGIVNGLFTPRAARQSAFTLAHLTPRDAEELFAEIGNMRPSRSTLDRLPKAISQQWEEQREGWERALRRRETVAAEAVTLVVSQDGVMAPMKDGERRKKRSNPEKWATGPAGYREVGCGTVSLHDAEGKRLQTVRYGRMPEKRKATLHTQLEAELQSMLALRPNLTVVKLADGAKDNWTSLENMELGLGPDIQVNQFLIVDFFHAAEHLKRACDAIWGKASIKGKAEFERLRILLKEHADGVGKIIRSLRYRVGRTTKQKKQRIQTELTYFRNQRHRMHYADYLQRNLPIASGVVEAACKTLVTQRMKCSGMAWSHPGGQAILTLRSLVQSCRWHSAWNFIKQGFQKSVTIRHPALADCPTSTRV
jgi:hypothetical protein